MHVWVRAFCANGRRSHSPATADRTRPVTKCWDEPATERFLQSVCAVLLTGPSNAGIGTDQHRKPCIDGNATYPSACWLQRAWKPSARLRRRENAHTILHDILESETSAYLWLIGLSPIGRRRRPAPTRDRNGWKGRSSCRRRTG